ncbi:MAG: hypothetical protein HC933_20035 [Pleurocapsa sp. SU_196_0]|nr:hypothetical protein [Pleurocapsa sp. SU_196_0]
MNIDPEATQGAGDFQPGLQLVQGGNASWRGGVLMTTLNGGPGSGFNVIVRRFGRRRVCS